MFPFQNLLFVKSTPPKKYCCAQYQHREPSPFEYITCQARDGKSNVVKLV